MQVKRITLLSAFLLQFGFSFGQAVHHAKVNTSGAEAYFEIASALVNGGDKNTISWQRLFQTRPYQMMIAGNAFDTAVLKSNMQHVFSPAS
ncbi:MAG: hypothetical protein EOO46_22270, partial [Flavobacterium sp.]